MEKEIPFKDVFKNKSKDIRKSFYDLEWNQILPEDYISSFYEANFKKPKNFDGMLRDAEKLSDGFF